MSHLTEREVQLLFQISSPHDFLSQRELAKRTGVSIGLINAVLRKLILSGFVRVKALNKKKLSYLLTPKGTIHMAQRSYQAVLNTIRNYQELETKIGILISQHIDNDHKNFFLYGDGELTDIVERVMRRQFKNSVVVMKKINNDPDTVVLNLTGSYVKMPGKVVNVVKYVKQTY